MEVKLGPKTRDILELILAGGADALYCLASRNYYSFGWDSKLGFKRQLRAMEARGLITRSDDSSDWIPEITQAGKQLAENHFDPETAWSDQWDGQWRVISFDLPAGQRAQRYELDSWLNRIRFGRLQGSLRISHRPHKFWSDDLAQLSVDPNALVLLEGEVIGTISDEQIVANAWDFDQINSLYSEYLNFLEVQPPPMLNDASRGAFPNWLRTECAIWRKAYSRDPFLPEELLPTEYLGKSAYNARKATFKNWDAGQAR